MSKRYFGRFDNLNDVIREFDISPADFIVPSDEEIILADYWEGVYEGAATVIFERNGALYEASGSHCSCYGLEGQWEPDTVLPEQLAMRDVEDAYGMSDAARLRWRELWPKATA